MNGLLDSGARDTPTRRRRSSPPETDDLSEFFFHDRCSPAEMCAAGDVFLHGKLLPFGTPPPRPPRKNENCSSRSLPRDQRRPDTAEGCHRPRGLWGGAITPEYQKLRRAPESEVKVAPPRSRPRWYLCVLGSVRVPAAMQMSDIRNRQRRRSPRAMAEAEDSGGWSFDRSKTWKLLRSLSCKGVESAVAAAPLSFVSHA